MLLGRVAGTLVASQKEANLEGLKFLVVRQLDVDNEETGGLRGGRRCGRRRRRGSGALRHRQLRPSDRVDQQPSV